VKRIGFRVWGGLALLTFPMTAQCCLAVLPNALAYSALLLQFACLIAAATGVTGLKTGVVQGTLKRTPLWGLYGLWLVESLLMPEYFWFGAIPAAVGTFLAVTSLLSGGKTEKSGEKKVKFLKNTGGRIGCLLLLAALTAGLSLGVLSFATEKGSLGRVERSTEAAAFRRVAGSSLAKYYSRWPEELKAGILQEVLAQAMTEPETVAALLQPQIEVVLGREEAKEWFESFSEVVFWDNYVQILREVGWDLAGNLLPAVTMGEVLTGRGYASLCSRNYETMREEHPLLAGYYISYSSWWMATGILILLLGVAMCMVCRFLKPQPGTCSGGSTGRNVARIALVSTVLLTAFWYTLQGAGVWDYKQTLLVGAVWMAWMVSRADKTID